MALVLLALAARVLFLAGSLEEVVNNDELTTGLLWQWLGGARALPLVDLWSPRMGGDALYQILALPLYALLGGSALAVKALALLVSVAGVLLLVAVGARHGGPRAGLYAGLCFALAPPGWVGLSLVATGDHLLTGLLTVACGHLLLLARGADRPRRGRLLVALGCLAGLALFANYLFAVSAVALVMLGLLARPQPGWRPRDAGRLLAGLGLGLLPLLLSVVVRGMGASTTVYGRGAAEQLQLDPLASLGRIGVLLGPDLVASAWFPPVGWGRIAAWCWWALLAAALASAAWRQRAVILGLFPGRVRAALGLDGFLLIFVVGFGLAFSLTRFEIEPGRVFGYRYLAVLCAPACLLAGLGLASLPRNPARVLAAWWWLPCLVALGWPGQLRSPLRVLDLPGVTWTNAAGRALDAWQQDLPGAFDRELPLVPEAVRGPFLVSLGGRIAERLPRAEALRVADSLDLRWRVHLYRGLIPRIRAGRDVDPALVGAVELLQAGQAGPPPQAADDPAGLLQRTQAQGGPPQLLALGPVLTSQVDRSPSRLAVSLGAVVEPWAVEPLCRGLGVGVALRHKTATDLARWRIPWDALLGPGCQDAFGEGLRETFHQLYAVDPAYQQQALGLFGLRVLGE